MNHPRPTGFLGLSHLGIITRIGWASLRSNLLCVSREVGPSGMSHRTASSNVAGEVG